ncbi:hypothetical protein ACVA51_10875 [Pseudomonas luteola]
MSTREEFEAWAVTHFCGPDFTKNSNGDYLKEWMRTSWAGWKASRAALMVELPPLAFSADPEGDAEWVSGSNEMREKCRAAIESAGVRVKP